MDGIGLEMSKVKTKSQGFLRRSAKGIAAIAFVGALSIGSYTIGSNRGETRGYVAGLTEGSAVQSQLEALALLPSAPGFLSHGEYAIRVVKNDSDQVEMYFQNRATSEITPIGSETVRYNKLNELHPTFMKYTLATADKMPGK